MFSSLRNWLVIAILTTALCGLIYLTIQQNYRQGANDPQIQIAEDLSQDLAAGKKIEEVIPKTQVDISKSLAPFVIIFDSGKRPTASNAVLDGKIPTLPTGVFDYVLQHGEDRVTWQPKPDVRIAAVIRNFGGLTSGYILAGRSLREIEIREDRLLKHVQLAWAATLAATLITTIFFGLFITKRRFKIQN